jgi:predicted CopG family antitoxin
MRILLDENLDWRLERGLPGHAVESVPRVGWAGTQNGLLLEKSRGVRFRRIRHHCRPDPRVRQWCQHGDLQSHRRGVTEAVAVSASRAVSRSVSAVVILRDSVTYGGVRFNPLFLVMRGVLTGRSDPCIGACMATKTISVDLEAYERLVRARRHNQESFSQVIKRAYWEESNYSGAAILAALEKLGPLDESTIRELEAIRKEDRPPRDKWTKRSRPTPRS